MSFQVSTEQVMRLRRASGKGKREYGVHVQTQKLYCDVFGMRLFTVRAPISINPSASTTVHNMMSPALDSHWNVVGRLSSTKVLTIHAPCLVDFIKSPPQTSSSSAQTLPHPFSENYRQKQLREPCFSFTILLRTDHTVGVKQRGVLCLYLFIRSAINHVTHLPGSSPMEMGTQIYVYQDSLIE